MSFAFDTLMSVWMKRVRPGITDATLAYRFEDLFEEMHSANHDVPDANGIFKGDGVNKSGHVTRAARDLEEYDRVLDSSEGGNGEVRKSG
ncbi:hypothetical protein LCGC14_1550560 [marine sediment metagenome]|uniref:Uncharacterized protein n=1 Tax=marine sediment metagenome TaxID=412755 RepID=A0A0F9L6D4_9ZZZZ